MNALLTAPARETLTGTQHYSNSALTQLPEGLQARRLVLENCPALEALPEGLRVRHLEIRNCPQLTTLPTGLHCYEIVAPESALERLPADLKVDFRLDLHGSPRLTALPVGLKVGTLNLSGCTVLSQLPEGLDVCFLDLQGCRQLKGWPSTLRIQHGHLNLADCTGLTSLPRGLADIAQLDLRNCAGITALPERLLIRSWLDVAGSGLTALPAGLKDVRLRWRGVTISARIAFAPDTITAQEILAEANSEVRRVMMERVGFERFLKEAKAETLDVDRDPGGERRLLRVALSGDEDLVCLSLFCPSTGRQYVLRVPPTVRSCRAAAAWMAGFDDPRQYQPILET